MGNPLELYMDMYICISIEYSEVNLPYSSNLSKFINSCYETRLQRHPPVLLVEIHVYILHADARPSRETLSSMSSEKCLVLHITHYAAETKEQLSRIDLPK